MVMVFMISTSTASQATGNRKLAFLTLKLSSHVALELSLLVKRGGIEHMGSDVVVYKIQKDEPTGRAV
jgi:hypothetical protein